MLDVGQYTSEVHPEAVYQALLDAGVFALPTCGACGRAHYSPRVMCPHCGSEDLSWQRSSGAGTVYSMSSISPRDRDPYAVILVDLDDGPRLMSNAVGMAADAVTIGMRVKVRIEAREAGSVPLFEGVDA